MMNYYVDWVANEGLLSEKKVQESFRLVAIEQQVEPDSTKFRQLEIFEKKPAEQKLMAHHDPYPGYGGDVNEVLSFEEEHPPVTFVFEGWVKPVSVDCCFNLLFTIILAMF